MSDILDLNREPTPSELAGMQRVATRLYCHGISQEFRRPVHLMYPEIASDYAKAIKDPMDLGSLILLLRKGGPGETLRSLLEKLKSIFANAVTYNTDAHQMIAISNHLNQFAEGLWVEAVKIPYTNDEQSLPTKTEFTNMRYVARFNRYRLARTSLLTLFEAKELLSILQETIKDLSGDAKASAAVVDAVKILESEISSATAIATSTATATSNTDVEERGTEQTSSTFTTPLSSSSSIAKEKEKEADATKKKIISRVSVTLEQILCTLIEAVFASCKFADDFIEGGALLPSFAAAKLGKFFISPSSSPKISISCLTALTALDESIAELLPVIQERLQRGFPLSCIWSRPQRFVWAQPPRESWYPGMVLCGHGVPRLLSASNFARIPADIARQLMRIKPKPTVPAADCESSSSEKIENFKFMDKDVEDDIVRDNCVLVEFFGSHDFGWIRLECLSEFPPDGSFVPPPISAEALAALSTRDREKRERCVQSSSNAMREALGASSAIKTCDNLASGNDTDSPSTEELTEIQALLSRALSSSTSRKSLSGGTPIGKQIPTVKVPRGFGDLVTITGPNSVSIHNLNPVELGLTVGSVNEILKNNMFLMNTISLHKGLSRQDRALWRTRIVATAMDLAKSVTGGQKIIRPRAPEQSSKKSKSSTPSSAGKSSTMVPKGIDVDEMARFTTKYASKGSIAAAKASPIVQGSQLPKEKKSGMKIDKGNIRFQDIGSPKTASKVFRDSQDLVEIVHIDTNKMYASSSETGRKWMIGIFAAPTMSSETAPTTLVSGEGALHVRKVNFKSPVFFTENKDSKIRKQLLRAEIEKIERVIATMEEEALNRKPLPNSLQTGTLQDTVVSGSSSKRNRGDVNEKDKVMTKKSNNSAKLDEENSSKHSESGHSINPKKRIRLTPEELERKYTLAGKKKPGPKKRGDFATLNRLSSPSMSTKTNAANYNETPESTDRLSNRDENQEDDEEEDKNDE
jgi:hypothetical protein